MVGFSQFETVLLYLLGGAVLLASGVVLMTMRRVKSVPVGEQAGSASSSGSASSEFSDWREMSEWHLQRELDALRALPEEELLGRVRRGKYDPHFNLWYALREKTTLAKAAPLLLQVLRKERGDDKMLTRYHCAAALFHLLGEPDDPLPERRKRVQFDLWGEDARLRAIDELEAEIRAMTSR